MNQALTQQIGRYSRYKKCKTADGSSTDSCLSGKHELLMSQGSRSLRIFTYKNKLKVETWDE